MDLTSWIVVGIIVVLGGIAIVAFLASRSDRNVGF
jgi:hypothetical protein